MGSEGLLFYLWDRRKVIILVTLLGVIGSVIASYVIDEKFKSTVIIYPTRSNSISKALLSDIPGSTNDILLYGDEEQQEQLLQILNSNRMIDDVNERFDLFTAYELDEKEKHRDTYMRLIYKDHVSAKPTRYGSVEIVVLDKDAQRAAEMANFMSDQIDVIKQEMLRERAGKGLLIVEQNIVEVEAELKWLNDSLVELRKHGVHEYNSQSERFNEQLGLAIVQGKQGAIKNLEARFDTLAKYGGAYIAIQSLIYNNLTRLSALREQYDRAKADLESDLPHKFVVDRAFPSDKKAYPIRWMIVALGGIGSFLISVFLLVLIENVKKLQAHHGRS